jgi:hypothetical protein
MRIEHVGDLVTLEDSTGALVREIGVGGVPSDASASSSDAQPALGRWKGTRLEVERAGPGGGKITETYELKDAGRTLVIETKVESAGPRPSMDFKRVYERVSPS